MKIKNLLSLLLAVILIFGCVSGCGTDTGQPSASQTAESSEATSEVRNEIANESAKITVDEPIDEAHRETTHEDFEETTEEKSFFPLDEAVTFTAWGTLIPPLISITTDLNNLQVYSSAEKQTNVHLQWSSVSVIGASENFQLMIASGDYPNLIKGLGNYLSGGIEAGVSEEIIIDLANFVDEYAPSYKAALETDEAYMIGATTDSGIIGSFCYLSSDEEVYQTKGAFFRKDWLDALELDVPVTVSDWYDIASAFYTEYGATYGIPAEGTTFGNFFEAAYDISVPFDNGAMSSGFFQIDGTVYFGPAMEGYRNYIEEMAKWYDEGLIATDFTSDTNSIGSGTVASDKITRDQVGIFYGSATQYVNYFESATDPEFDLVAVGAPVLKKGQTTHTRGLSSKVAPALSLSTSIPDDLIETAVRWGDWWYTDTGYITSNWGIEGETFNYNTDGEPVYTDLVMNNQDMSLDAAIIMYTMSEMGDHFKSDGRRIYQYYTEEAMSYKKLWSEGDDNAYVIPTDISMTVEETENLSNYTSEINTYVSEMTLKFITGNASIKDEWDSYMEFLENSSLDEACAVYEIAYARYLER